MTEKPSGEDIAALLETLGQPVMDAAREAVQSAYHDVPEGAVDLAAVTALDVAYRAARAALRLTGSSLVQGEEQK